MTGRPGSVCMASSWRALAGTGGGDAWRGTARQETDIVHADVRENEVLGDDGYTTQPSRQHSIAAVLGVVHEARALGDWQWSVHMGHRHRLPCCSRDVANNTLTAPDSTASAQDLERNGCNARMSAKAVVLMSAAVASSSFERDGHACPGQMLHWRPTPRPVRRVAMVARPWCVGGDTCGSESVALSAGGGRAVVVPATLGA